MFGVYGEWGAGKTTYMRLLHDQLDKAQFRRVFFEPWKYEGKQGILLPLMQEIEREIGDADALEPMKRKLVDLSVTGEAIGMLAADLVTVGLATKASKVLESVEKRQEKARGLLLETYKKWDDDYRKLQGEFDKLTKPTTSEGREMVIFIDDLDRCHPRNMVELLDSLKHFLHSKHCKFVLAIDPTVVAEGVKSKYPNLSGVRCREYLEKIVLHAFHVPIIQTVKFEGFVRHLFGDDEAGGKEVQALVELVRPISSCTPRKLVRIRNKLLCIRSVNEKHREVLGKLLVYQEFWPDSFDKYITLNKVERRTAEEFAISMMQTNRSKQSEGIADANYRCLSGHLKLFADELKKEMELVELLSRRPLFYEYDESTGHMKTAIQLMFL